MYTEMHFKRLITDCFDSDGDDFGKPVRAIHIKPLFRGWSQPEAIAHLVLEDRNPRIVHKYDDGKPTYALVLIHECGTDISDHLIKEVRRKAGHIRGYSFRVEFSDGTFEELARIGKLDHQPEAACFRPN